MSSFVVRRYSGKRVAKGDSVFVYGMGFGSTTKAWLKNGSDYTEENVVDYDDRSLKILCGNVVGAFVLCVGTSSDDRIEVGPVSVVSDTKSFLLHGKIEHTDIEVRNAMLGLLPRGSAWCKSVREGEESNFAKLFLGLAAVVVRFYENVMLFLREASPTHTESFTEWESELRLPEDGVSYYVAPDATDEQKYAMEVKRRNEIVRKACKVGGCTKSFFKSVALLFGISGEIIEYWETPSAFSQVTDPEDLKRYYWMFKSNYGIEGVTVLRCGNNSGEYEGRPFVCGNARCGMRLRWWVNPDFCSMIDNLKPSHTKCLYAFAEQGD